MSGCSSRTRSRSTRPFGTHQHPPTPLVLFFHPIGLKAICVGSEGWNPSDRPETDRVVRPTLACWTGSAISVPDQLHRTRPTLIARRQLPAPWPLPTAPYTVIHEKRRSLATLPAPLSAHLRADGIRRFVALGGPDRFAKIRGSGRVRRSIR